MRLLVFPLINKELNRQGRCNDPPAGFSTGRTGKRDDYTCQGCGWNQDDMKRANVKKGLPVHHVIPLEDWDGEPSEYPDFLLSTMCPNCHSKSDNHVGAMKWPRSSRGDKAKPENLENPRERQTSLDEFYG
ncbi:MAG: HNH endonuclease [Candidatus Thorarchaeota archaeon]